MGKLVRVKLSYDIRYSTYSGDEDGFINNLSAWANSALLNNDVLFDLRKDSLVLSVSFTDDVSADPTMDYQEYDKRKFVEAYKLDCQRISDKLEMMIASIAISTNTVGVKINPSLSIK